MTMVATRWLRMGGRPFSGERRISPRSGTAWVARPGLIRPLDDKTLFTKAQKQRNALVIVDLLSAMTTFLRVVDAGSLSKAGKMLQLSPAAISRQMSALEGELGARLLVRTTRQLALTEEGRRFYEYAARTVRDAEDARASVRPDHAVSGLLTVSVPTAVGLPLFDESLAQLLATHRGLRVDLRLEDHPIDLIADGVDIAVRAGLPAPDTTSLVALPLADADRVVVAAPSYLRRHRPPSKPEELSRHDALVQLHAGPGVGVWTLYSGAQTVSIPVTGRLCSNSLLALRAAAIAGFGVALLPRLVVADALENEHLRALPLGGWQPRGQQIYALVRAESRDRARVRIFLAHAKTRLSRVQ
jgi:DNA-binding transcriptional LysR family regulator